MKQTTFQEIKNLVIELGWIVPRQPLVPSVLFLCWHEWVCSMPSSMVKTSQLLASCLLFLKITCVKITRLILTISIYLCDCAVTKQAICRGKIGSVFKRITFKGLCSPLFCLSLNKSVHVRAWIALLKPYFFFPLFFSQLEMLKQPGMIIVAVLGSTLKLVLIRDIESSVPIWELTF